MTNQYHNPDDIDSLLKEIYNEQPLDSWNHLRNRIESRIEKYNEIQNPDKEHLFKKLPFWWFLSLSLAACLLLTFGLLVFQGINHRHSNPPLLTQHDIQQLSEAFVQIRELFQDQAPWFAVGPGEKTMIGLNLNHNTSGQRRDIVILRLVLNTPADLQTDNYYDIVTYVNKKATLQLRMSNSDVLITVTPLLVDNGKIEIVCEAQMDDNTIIKDKYFIADNAYTPLANISTHLGSVNIIGTGYVITKL